MSTQGISPFPDILAPKETKRTPTYGLEYVKAIWGAHITNIIPFNTQRDRDLINRKYAEALQSVQNIKDLKGTTNTSYSNFDYSQNSIIATRVDQMVGKLSKVPFKIQVNAIDPESKSMFDKYRREQYATMFLKPYSDAIEQKTGIPLVPKNKKIPETDEEVELDLKMNYKDAVSIYMEEAFNFVFSANKFEKERRQILRNLITIKRGAINNYYDENWNICVQSEDPVDVITPYAKYPDHRNDPYVAVIKSFTIGQISEMYDFTDKEIYEIAKSQAGNNNNPAWTWATSYEGYYNSNFYGGVRPFYNFNIQVLEFYFLGIDQEDREIKTYKNRKYTNKVSSDFKLKNPDAEVVSKRIQNLYKGKWVIGTDYIFDYKISENIPRKKINGAYVPKATLPIKIIAPGIYDMQNKSHVERMIPHADAMKLAELAMQTLMIKMKPPGVHIDIQGLMDAARGMGMEGKPIEIVKIYEATGNLITSSRTDEGEIINSKVITELRGGLGGAMVELVQAYQFHGQLINEVIGYNSAVDASSPSAEALVGVQEHAIQATNDSLAPLFDAHLDLVEATAQEIGLMIQDCIEYNNEAFIDAIGKAATDTLKEGRDMALVELGIKIELLPDDNEKAQLNQLIQLGIEQQVLTPSDVVRIYSVMKEDVKLAARWLIFLEEKNRKNKMEEAAQQQQQNGQIQKQSAQVAAQAQAQLDQELTKNKIIVMQTQNQLDMQKLQMEFELQMKLQGLKNEGSATVAEIGAGGKVNVQDAANKGKVVAAQVAADSKVITEHIKHGAAMEQAGQSHIHNLNQVAFENAIEPKETTLKNG